MEASLRSSEPTFGLGPSAAFAAVADLSSDEEAEGAVTPGSLLGVPRRWPSAGAAVSQRLPLPPQSGRQGGLPGDDGHWLETDNELGWIGWRLGADVVDLVRLPAEMDRRQWRTLGLAALAVSATALFDDQIRSAVNGDTTRGNHGFAEAVRPLGREPALIALGGLWLGGRALHHEKWIAVSEDSLEATVLAAGLVTPILKIAIGRTRPRTGDPNDTFFQNGRSFPSGETTQAFAIASVVAAHSDQRWVDTLAWGLAGLTGWQRMRLDGHWASDVVAGALIGAGVGRWVVRRNRPELSGEPRWSFTPMVGSGALGGQLAWTF